MYGMLDDVPDELMYEGSIAIQFESPAVHMQQSGAIVGLYKTMEAAAAMAQSNPDVLKVLIWKLRCGKSPIITGSVPMW